MRRLAENLWLVTGKLPSLGLRRNMVVARQDDGRLVIHNAIAVNEATRRELAALGEPSALIVPSGYHRMDAPAYRAAFPSLRVVAPQGARAKVEEVVPVDATYDDTLGSEDSSVLLEHLDGVAKQEGVMLVRSKDGTTVVLNDAVFNMDSPSKLLPRVITTILGSAPGPRVSRLVKYGLMKDRAMARAHLERLASLPDLVRVIVAHDKVAEGAEAKRALLTAAGGL